MKREYAFDENDEIDEIDDVDNMSMTPDDDGFGPDGRIQLDNPYEEQYVDEDDDEELSLYDRPVRSSGKKTLISALEDELKLLEPYRGELAFRYRGIDYVGVPMLKINDSKFVFKCMVDGKEKLMSVILPEVIVKAM